MFISELAKRIEQGEHLTRQEYLQLAEEAPLETIQQLADALRQRLHLDNIVTYVVDRNI
jgi:cyclic dehypoxanthinyl futalosine synthase